MTFAYCFYIVETAWNDLNFFSYFFFACFTVLESPYYRRDYRLKLELLLYSLEVFRGKVGPTSRFCPHRKGHIRTVT